MILPEFNHKEQQWDQYKEFYVTHGGGRWGTGLFVQFTTGELICASHFRTSSGWGHSRHSRGEFEKLGLTVFQLNDRPGCLYNKKLWDPETGSEVKRSWLPQATPMLLDHKHKRIVVIRWHSKHEKLAHGMPERFVGRCGAYWAGPERPPVGGGPVWYAKLNTWSREQWREARAIAQVIKTQVRLGVVKEPVYPSRGCNPVTVEQLLKKPISNMTDDFKLAVAKAGLSAGYNHVSTDYLEVRDV